MSQKSNGRSFLIFFGVVFTPVFSSCNMYSKPSNTVEGTTKIETTKLAIPDSSINTPDYTALSAAWLQNYCSTDYDR